MNFLKKLFYKVAQPFRVLYWFIFRPKTFGVKALIECRGKFMMIRNSYGHQGWTFPGGGVEKGESLEQAAGRESWEEVGIKVEKLEYLGSYFHARQFKRDTVHCFYGQALEENFTIDDGEIAEARWFNKNQLPNDQAKAVADVLSLYEKYLQKLH